MTGLAYRLAMGLAILHMVAGCCWHHAHGRESGHDGGAERGAWLPHPGTPCAPCGTRPADGHSAPQPCAEDSCELAVGQRASSAASDWVPHQLAWVPAAMEATLSRQTVRQAAWMAGTGGPPVRLHLLHRLLLI